MAAATVGASTPLNSLMAACQRSQESDVRAILLRKPLMVHNRDRTGKTALHYCAENRNVSCAEQVLSADPSLINAQDEDGHTALHLAVIAGNRTLVRYLIRRGADVDRVDHERHSPIHWATVCGELECLDLLMDAGADPGTPDIHGAYPVHYAAQMCGPNSEMGNDVRVGLAVLRKLLARGVDVNVRDQDGRQPLLWAASAETRASKTYCPSGSSDAILALVNAGANVMAEDKDGLTSLHCAASRGHHDCLETLVTLCGAEVDVIDSNGCTALFYAVTLGHVDCTQLLLQFGAEPNRPDRRGRTPAHCGAAKGQLETLKVLAKHGANLWVRNVRGDLPVHEAVQSGRKDLVRWLFQQQPTAVNSPNSTGRTPLHIAALNNNVEMCKVIMDHGGFVNPIMRNSKGQLLTPLDAAVHRGNHGCAKYLQLHGALPANKLLERTELTRVPRRPSPQRGAAFEDHQDFSVQTDISPRDDPGEDAITHVYVHSPRDRDDLMVTLPSSSSDKKHQKKLRLYIPDEVAEVKVIPLKEQQQQIHLQRLQNRQLYREPQTQPKQILQQINHQMQQQSPPPKQLEQEQKQVQPSNQQNTQQRKNSQPQTQQKQNQQPSQQRKQSQQSQNEHKITKSQQENQTDQVQTQSESLEKQSRKQSVRSEPLPKQDIRQPKQEVQPEAPPSQEVQSKLQDDVESQRGFQPIEDSSDQTQAKTVSPPPSAHEARNSHQKESEDVDKEIQNLDEIEDEKDSFQTDDASRKVASDLSKKVELEKSVVSRNYEPEKSFSPMSSIQSSESTFQKDSGYSDLDRIPSEVEEIKEEDERTIVEDAVGNAAPAKAVPKSVQRKKRRDAGHLEDRRLETRTRSNGRVPRTLPLMDRLLGRPESGGTSLSVTQQIQQNVRKSDRALHFYTFSAFQRYQLERKLFQELQDVKHHQIRSGRTNESVLVKRLVEKFRKNTLAPGMRDFDGPYTYKCFERYLYEQLRALSLSNHGKVFKPKPLIHRPAGEVMAANPAQCVCQTHRCRHVTDAYGGTASRTAFPRHTPILPSIQSEGASRSRIPVSAVQPRSRSLESARQRALGAPLRPSRSDASLGPSELPEDILAIVGRRLSDEDHGEVLVEMVSEDGQSRHARRYPVRHLKAAAQMSSNDPSVTFEVSHGKDKSVFKLPFHELANNKRWQVTFTIGKQAHKV